MCNLSDGIYRDGKLAGKLEGKLEGKQDGLMDSYRAVLKKKLSPKDAREFAPGLSDENAAKVEKELGIIATPLS